jgi:hypothetical protein
MAAFTQARNYAAEAAQQGYGTNERLQDMWKHRTEMYQRMMDSASRIQDFDARDNMITAAERFITPAMQGLNRDGNPTIGGPYEAAYYDPVVSNYQKNAGYVTPNEAAVLRDTYKPYYEQYQAEQDPAKRKAIQGRAQTDINQLYNKWYGPGLISKTAGWLGLTSPAKNKKFRMPNMANYTFPASTTSIQHGATQVGNAIGKNKFTNW